MKFCVLLQLAAVGDGDVSFDSTKDDNGTCADVAYDSCVFTDCQVALGIDFALDSTIDDEVVRKPEFTANFYVAGKDISATGDRRRRYRFALR